MDTLRELFRYNTWATLQLIDHLATLSPQSLRVTAPGTAGTVIATLVHLVAAEQRYLAAMPGAVPGITIREGMEPSLAELRTQFEAQARAWETLLDRGPDLDVTLPPRRDWPETPHAQVLFFLQTLHHGNDHRTHICTVLGAHDLPTPDIDGWSYWSAVHHGSG